MMPDAPAYTRTCTHMHGMNVHLSYLSSAIELLAFGSLPPPSRQRHTSKKGVLLQLKHTYAIIN